MFNVFFTTLVICFFFITFPLSKLFVQWVIHIVRRYQERCPYNTQHYSSCASVLRQIYVLSIDKNVGNKDTTHSLDTTNF
jgi:hypothetical protein